MGFWKNIFSKEVPSAVSSKHTPTQQFSEHMFGEFILNKFQNTTEKTSAASVLGLSAKFPKLPQSAIMEWIDDCAPRVYDPNFWRKNTEEVFEDLCSEARNFLIKYGIQATKDQLFSMTEIIFNNYVYSGYSDHRFIDFIQRSIEDLIQADSKIASVQADNTPFGHSIALNIISPYGLEVKVLLIGIDISERDCLAFIDSATNELYAIKPFEAGIPKSVIIRKQAWDIINSRMNELNAIEKNENADEKELIPNFLSDAIENAHRGIIAAERNKILAGFYHNACNNKAYTGLYKLLG